ncbi:MAG: DMT family transporter [Gammaproteobacteria bacterium]|nr:DMT family transporter [Gammaproteobacteria bacterium]MCW5584284.1 DMT family transporter [Gammaproteobacteria bacterium]
MTKKTKSAIAITIVLWASGFVGIRVGLRGYSPEGLALLRYLIASICMAIIYFRLPKRSSMRLLDMAALMCVGAIGIGLYNLTLNYGELSISSGIASFITSQAPIITTVLAVCFLGESISTPQILGLMVSVMGVALITFSEKGGLKWDTGVFYILIATLAAGLFSVLQKPFLKKYHAIEATTYIIWGATLFLSLYIPKLQHDLMFAPLKTTIIVLYLGIFPAAIAYVAWSYVLAKMPASQAVSFLYFMPFVATLLGWLCLGEVPVMMSLVGGLLAIIGVWLVNQSYRFIPVKNSTP